jgi:hypothetical protein
MGTSDSFEGMTREAKPGRGMVVPVKACERGEGRRQIPVRSVSGESEPTYGKAKWVESRRRERISKGRLSGTVP